MELAAAAIPLVPAAGSLAGVATVTDPGLQNVHGKTGDAGHPTFAKEKTNR